MVVHRCLPLALVRWAPGRRWEHASLQKARLCHLFGVGSGCSHGAFHAGVLGLVKQAPLPFPAVICSDLLSFLVLSCRLSGAQSRHAGCQSTLLNTCRLSVAFVDEMQAVWHAFCTRRLPCNVVYHAAVWLSGWLSGTLVHMQAAWHNCNQRELRQHFTLNPEP